MVHIRIDNTVVSSTLCDEADVDRAGWSNKIGKNRNLSTDMAALESMNLA